MSSGGGFHRMPSKWMSGEGPSSDIAVSSRVRLARNLTGYAFPHRMNQEETADVLAAVRSAARWLGETTGHDFSFMPLNELGELDRLVLVEKHLVSPRLVESPDKGAIVLRDDEGVAIMVNEEDHLRIQCLLPGLQLEEAWQAASEVDDVIDGQVDYAYDIDRGYLTACPTNVGTGLRASVMMHLPALVMSQRVSQLLSALAKVGIMVRGLYGEGSQAQGNLFQVSNQVTLGQTELDIMRNLSDAAAQVIEQERSARELLYSRHQVKLEDKVCRAYGILANARSISSEESLSLLSDLRLGIDLNIISHVPPELFNELFIQTRRAFLQKSAGGVLSAQERDVHRAGVIRKALERLGQ